MKFDMLEWACIALAVVVLGVGMVVGAVIIAKTTPVLGLFLLLATLGAIGYICSSTEMAE